MQYINVTNSLESYAEKSYNLVKEPTSSNNEYVLKKISMTSFRMPLQGAEH
jgi:hypothetical protein